jgi:hypothetical protein
LKVWNRKVTTRYVAAGMVGIAIVGGLVDWLVGARAWMPNVVVGALTVAATVTVVDRAFRNEQRARDKPILDVITTRVELQMMGFIYALLSDYSITHLDTFKPIPETLEQLCDLWLDGSEDASRPERPVGSEPPLLHDARRLANHLNAARAQYAFVIDKNPALVDAIERFSEWVAQTSVWIEREKAGLGAAPTAFDDTMRRRIVGAARNFAQVFLAATGHEIRISDEQRAAAEQWNDAGHAIAAQRATIGHSDGSDSPIGPAAGK